jgi:hypothetical protein
VHFGLGDAAKVDEVEIHWPSRTVEKLKLSAIDRIYTVTEGKGITGALCGGKACAAGSGAVAPRSKKALATHSSH